MPLYFVRFPTHFFYAFNTEPEITPFSKYYVTAFVGKALNIIVSFVGMFLINISVLTSIFQSLIMNLTIAAQ